MLRIIIILLLLPLNSFAFSFNAKARNHIQIVGSSTVYPFVATIAESFGRNTQFKTPIVESTGTGGGFKLFCSGAGYNFPDFSNASRKIEKSEISKCNLHGINGIIEIKIGYDGIVLANSLSGNKFNLTKKQIFLALADKIPDQEGKLISNPHKFWNEIDKSLPKIKIAVYGPPSTSGTRDAFAELIMEESCEELKEFKAIYPDEKIRKKKCRIIRNDEHFIEAGENDNLIVQKLKNNPNALGIFGFSFLEENHDSIQPSVIENKIPKFETIISGEYKVSRPLFIYFKKEHLNIIPGMRDFIKEIVSTNTIGKDGYLLQKGLIPLSDLETNTVRNEVISSLN